MAAPEISRSHPFKLKSKPQRGPKSMWRNTKKKSGCMRGMIESPSVRLSIKQHGDTEQYGGCRGPIMYFPSLGRMVIATSHWLSCNLQLVADTQSLRQFSRRFVTMATAFQPPSPSSKIGQSCHFRSFAR